VRQLLTESALLGLMAGVLAFFFSWAFLKISASLAAGLIPADEGTLVFGVTPALESSRSALFSAARGSTSPLRSRRIQGILIAAQVAFSLVLMIAGSMLVRSSINTLKMETGYDSKRVVELDLQFPISAKHTAERELDFVRDLRRRLADLPGVSAVTSANPPGGSFFRTPALAIQGDKSLGHNLQFIHYTFVQDNYFSSVGIPISGRAFRSHASDSDHSVIVSESAAKQLWPGQDPIGRSL